MKEFEKYKKYIKYFIATLIIISFFMWTYIEGKDNKNNDDQIIEMVSVEENEQIEEKDEFIIIDIKGAINKPGAYKLSDGKRIYDAIRVSGGLRKDADTSLINLSKRLLDEMVIIIHTKDEVNDYKTTEPTIIYKDVPCVCPEYKNDGCIEVVDEKSNKELKNDKISINNASLEDLITLPGIGEAKAKSIIEYRKTNEFKTIEDILKVKGIGESVFDKIKQYIAV